VRAKISSSGGGSSGLVRPGRYASMVRNRMGHAGTCSLPSEACLGRACLSWARSGNVHCDDGGPGPNTFDYLSALEQWVEKDIAPEKMLATHFDLNGNPDRTQPLCAYPKIAQYNGSGSIDDASNFSCVAPPDNHDTTDKKLTGDS